MLKVLDDDFCKKNILIPLAMTELKVISAGETEHSTNTSNSSFFVLPSSTQCLHNNTAQLSAGLSAGCYMRHTDREVP